MFQVKVIRDGLHAFATTPSKQTDKLQLNSTYSNDVANSDGVAKSAVAESAASNLKSVQNKYSRLKPCAAALCCLLLFRRHALCRVFAW